MRRALLLARMVAPCAVAALVGATATASLGATSRIPAAKLALMVLPRAALGASAAGLKLDASSSGAQDAAAAAENSIDPTDTAATIRRSGRVSGYQLAYGDPSLAALTRGSGVFEIDSEVDLYRDGTAASAAITKDLRDLRRYAGRTVSGVRLEHVETLHLPKLGDEAAGLRLSISIGSKHATATGVELRVGELVGSVEIARADGKDVSGETISLARALERRIRGVLAGTVTGSPVPLPSKKPAAGTPSTRPAGSPDLATAVLRPADLPAGATVTASTYRRDGTAIATYDRSYHVSGRLPSGSRLVSLENDVSLYPSRSEAGLVLLGVAGVFGQADSAAFRRFFASKFREGAGFTLTSLKVVRNRPLATGDGGRDVTVRIGTPIGSFDVAFVFVRSARLVGSLYAVAAPGTRLAPADVSRLAALAVRRMHAAPVPKTP